MEDPFLFRPEIDIEKAGGLGPAERLQEFRVCPPGRTLENPTIAFLC
jgi:hypothetical protein